MLFHARTVLQLCVAALSATATAIPGRVQRPLSVEGGAVQRPARLVPGLACVQSPCSQIDEVRAVSRIFFSAHSPALATCRVGH